MRIRLKARIRLLRKTLRYKYYFVAYTALVNGKVVYSRGVVKVVDVLGIVEIERDLSYQLRKVYSTRKIQVIATNILKINKKEYDKNKIKNKRS